METTTQRAARLLTMSNAQLIMHAQDLTKQRDELLAAAERTLDENGHLADGDNCTLIILKTAVARLKGGTP